MVFDYRQAGLNAADRALCDYAVKLTLTPGEVSQADLQQLRGHGLSETECLIAVQVIGYFNYINRVADGLGVDREEWMTLSETEWKDRKANWR